MKGLRFTIPGPPRTKKNSSQVVRAGKGNKGKIRVIPSAAWREWCEQAVLDLAAFKRRVTCDLPLICNYNCTALFYRDALRGDAVGFYQGLADVLQKAGIVADDVQIVSWDGSRLLKDTAAPRVEVTLTALNGENPDARS